MIKKWLNDVKEGRPLWLAECREEMKDDTDAVSTVISVITDAGEKREFPVLLPKVETQEEIELMYRYLDANRVNAAMLLGQHDDTDCAMPDTAAILSKIRESVALASDKTADGAVSDAELGLEAEGQVNAESLQTGFKMPEEPLICGVDVGGSDIKLVLAEGSRIRRILSYDWNPAIATEAAMILNPIYELIEMAANGRRLDGIGISFPDKVTDNKIVDSKTSKTAGIRANKDIDYDAEFKKLSNLDDFLRPLVKEGAPVKILNDGDMAAFAVYNELLQTEAGRDLVKDGIIALPIGTDIGFGWVKADGSIPAYTGKASDCILRIDNPDEAKFLNQERLLTLAKMPTKNPKPCVDMLINMAEGGEPNAETLFKNLGTYLGHVIREIDYFMKPETNKYMLMGRFAKSEYVFDLMCIGLQQIAPDAVVLQIDASIANTPILKAIADIDPGVVPEFAQAVGAIYYALK